MKRVGQFNKLVRGRIPTIIRDDGRVPITRVLSPDARKPALIDKIREEVGELEFEVLNSNRERVLKEAADVYEVLIATLSEFGYVDRDLFDTARKKRLNHGSFDAGVWLESVEEATK